MVSKYAMFDESISKDDKDMARTGNYTWDENKMDGWMTCDFTSFFNSVSVISERCMDDHERLCAMELRSRLRRYHLE